MLDLKKETAIKLQTLGISQDTTISLFEKGLMDERTAKKFLVKKEYHEANPKEGHKCDTIEELADKFCCSFETVKRYIRG